MNKKTGVNNLFVSIGLGLLLFAGILGILHQKKHDNQKPFATLEDIIKKVERSGADVSELQVRVKLNQAPFQNEQEAQSYRQKIAQELGVDLNNQVREIRRQELILYQGETKTPEGTTITFHQNFGENVESSMSFTFKGPKQQEQELRNYTNVLEDVTKNNNVVLQINTCVVGKVNVKLKNDLQKEKIQQVLASFQGEVVESLEDYTVMSVSAYTPQIPFQITTNRKPMNLQVASHVDDYRNETTLIVGTPIITTEY